MSRHSSSIIKSAILKVYKFTINNKKEFDNGISFNQVVKPWLFLTSTHLGDESISFNFNLYFVYNVI
jgi:hypothetical protein